MTTSRQPASYASAAHSRANHAHSTGAEITSVCPGCTFRPTRTSRAAYSFSFSSMLIILSERQYS